MSTTYILLNIIVSFQLYNNKIKPFTNTSEKISILNVILDVNILTMINVCLFKYIPIDGIVIIE